MTGGVGAPATIAGMTMIRRPRSDRRPGPARGPANRWLAAGYAGLAAFVAAESIVRKPGVAASLAASSSDRGTTRIVGAAWGLAFEIPLLTRRIPLRPAPRVVAPAGLAAQAAGVALHVWSMRTLGRWYTKTLRIDGEQQSVVDAGPYRLIRHPGYLGALMTWTGFALTSRSIPSLVLVPAVIGAAYHARVGAEEAMLRRDLPGYTEYCRRTRRLIPFVW